MIIVFSLLFIFNFVVGFVIGMSVRDKKNLRELDRLKKNYQEDKKTLEGLKDEVGAIRSYSKYFIEVS